jgi:hypothetical protein
LWQHDRRSVHNHEKACFSG